MSGQNRPVLGLVGFDNARPAVDEPLLDRLDWHVECH